MKEIITRLYDAFAARDLEALESILAPDVVWAQMRGFPGGAVRHGREAVVEGVLDGNRKRWPGFSVQVDELVGDGDRVVALGRYAFEGADGAVVAPFAHAYRIREGRVVAFEQYTDTRVLADASV